MQANKLASHFHSAYRRRETPESETKDFITYSTTSSMYSCSYGFPLPSKSHKGHVEAGPGGRSAHHGAPSLGSSNLLWACSHTSLPLFLRGHTYHTGQKPLRPLLQKEMVCLFSKGSLEQRLPMSLFKRCSDNLVGSGQDFLMRCYSHAEAAVI